MFRVVPSEFVQLEYISQSEKQKLKLKDNPPVLSVPPSTQKVNEIDAFNNTFKNRLGESPVERVLGTGIGIALPCVSNVPGFHKRGNYKRYMFRVWRSRVPLWDSRDPTTEGKSSLQMEEILYTWVALVQLDG